MQIKKLILIAQAKGGAGKSVLTFLVAQKYPTAKFLDLDDGTKTTLKQLKYKEPTIVSFLNENKTIDRGMFNTFLEKVANTESNLIIGDLGASISEQLPQYIQDIGSESLASLLEQVNV